VQKHDLSACAASRLMFVSDYRGSRINLVFDACGGKTQRINFTRPEVAGDRKQVRIADERAK
jgi:hypothetical protein